MCADKIIFWRSDLRADEMVIRCSDLCADEMVIRHFDLCAAVGRMQPYNLSRNGRDSGLRSAFRNSETGQERKMQQKMLYMRKTPIESALILYLLAAGLVMFPYQWLGDFFTQDEQLAGFLGLGALRVVFFAVMLLLAFHMGIRGILLPRRGAWKALLIALPALAVAVNNLPIVALAKGTAAVTAGGGSIAAFAFQCFGVALFEEMAFRGVIFPFVLGKTGTGKKGRFIGVLAASAAFGLLHLVNLLGGVSGGVFLQVGYSFLIGCMLSVVMFCGGGVLVCTVIHAVYNFCGSLVIGLGVGKFWDIWCPEEIILTAAVALAAGIFFFFALLKSKPDFADSFAVYPSAKGDRYTGGQTDGTGGVTDKCEGASEADATSSKNSKAGE